MSEHDSASASTPFAQENPPDQPNRRRMLEVVTGALSFLLIAVPSVLGGLFFLDQLLRKRSSGPEDQGGGETDGFIKLNVTTDSIPDDGTPVAATVITDLDDAWNRFRDVPVGSVWLRKTGDGKIIAFNSICPHLGCSVDYRRNENDFFCPCHTSGFDLDGHKTNDIPPRDMDSLEVILASNGQPDNSGNELWVKFQNFRRATSEKKPI